MQFFSWMSLVPKCHSSKERSLAEGHGHRKVREGHVGRPYSAHGTRDGTRGDWSDEYWRQGCNEQQSLKGRKLPATRTVFRILFRYISYHWIILRCLRNVCKIHKEYENDVCIYMCILWHLKNPVSGEVCSLWNVFFHQSLRCIAYINPPMPSDIRVIWVCCQNDRPNSHQNCSV